jgi:hypothetical protein
MIVSPAPRPVKTANHLMLTFLFSLGLVCKIEETKFSGMPFSTILFFSLFYYPLSEVRQEHLKNVAVSVNS